MQNELRNELFMYIKRVCISNLVVAQIELQSSVLFETYLVSVPFLHFSIITLSFWIEIINLTVYLQGIFKKSISLYFRYLYSSKQSISDCKIRTSCFSTDFLFGCIRRKLDIQFSNVKQFLLKIILQKKGMSIVSRTISYNANVY